MAAFQLILFLSLAVLSRANPFGVPQGDYGVPQGAPQSLRYQRALNEAEAEAFAIANVEAVAAGGQPGTLIREKRHSGGGGGGGGIDHIVEAARACLSAASAAASGSGGGAGKLGCKGCLCYGHSCWGGHGKKK